MLDKGSRDMRTTYRNSEVRGLIENYTELRDSRDTVGPGLMILIQLADVWRAFRALPPKEYQAVLLHGLLRHTVRDAEAILGVSKSTLSDRYDSGLSWITRYLNEGDE